MWGINAGSMGNITESEWKSANLTNEKAITEFMIGKFRLLQQCDEKFETFFMFLFDFCKANKETQRIVDIETCISVLDAIFSSECDEDEVTFSNLAKQRYPHIVRIIRYLSENILSIKCLNKDQWSNLLSFSKAISLNFENYDINSAWPILLDNYVIWCKNKEQ